MISNPISNTLPLSSITTSPKQKIIFDPAKLPTDIKQRYDDYHDPNIDTIYDQLTISIQWNNNILTQHLYYTDSDNLDDDIILTNKTKLQRTPQYKRLNNKSPELKNDTSSQIYR